MPGYSVIFYEEGGLRPVETFLRDLPKKAKIKAERWIQLLGEKGIEMPSAYSNKLQGSPLHELIINYRTNAYRVFYFFSGKFIILVHGFVKKTNETPKPEITLAEIRMKNWEVGRK